MKTKQKSHGRYLNGKTTKRKKVEHMREPQIMTDRDLSEELAGEIPPPSEDSPGDSADDAMREFAIGVDFARDPIVEEEDEPLAERRLREEKAGATAGESADVHASPLPNPVEDLDSPTSTH